MKAETTRETLDWGSLGWLCNPQATGNEHLTVLDVDLKPGLGHDFHYHPAQEEMIICVAGSVEQWIDKEMRVLNAGDAAFIDKGVVHASFNTGTDMAKVIAILGPCAGDIGYEVEEVAHTAPWDTLRAGGV